MAVIKVIGEKGYKLTKESRGFDKTNGETVTQTYEGPIGTAANIYAQYKTDIGNNNREDIVSIKYDSAAGMDTLTITLREPQSDGNFSSGAIEERWYLRHQELMIKLRALPDLVVADQGYLDEIDVAISEGKPNPHDDGEPYTNYYELRKRGTEEFFFSQPILIHEQTCATTSDVVVEWEDINKPVTFNSLSISGRDKTRISKQMSNWIEKQVSGGTVQSVAMHRPTKKQWLKKAVEDEHIEHNRFRITTEYWYAYNWSYLIYGGEQETDNY